MRTIDADALKKHIDKLPALPDGNFAGNHSALKALINIQTTIEPEPHWIPVTEKLPEEHDTMFAKYWGTDRWNKYMFRKRSDLVEVTVELDDGTRVTEASRTRDGKWAIEEEYGFVHKKVVAWHPMSEPWKGE